MLAVTTNMNVTFHTLTPPWQLPGQYILGRSFVWPLAGPVVEPMSR